MLTEDPGEPIFTEPLAGSVLTKDPGDPVLAASLAGSVLTEDPGDPVLTGEDPVSAEFLWAASTQPPVIKTSATLIDAVATAPRRT